VNAGAGGAAPAKSARLAGSPIDLRAVSTTENPEFTEKIPTTKSTKYTKEEMFGRVRSRRGKPL